MSSFEAVLKEPGQFIAAVPAMLGFVPERSLVVAVLRQSSAHTHDVQVVARLDLPPAGQDSLLPERLVKVCRSSGAVHALAVIIDDRASRPDDACGANDVEHQRLVDRLRQDLAACDVVLAGAWAMPRISEAARWWNIESPEFHGLLPDPSASQVAAQHVFAGRVLRSSREELVDFIAIDKVMRAQVLAHLPDAAADAQRRLARAIQINNPDAYTRMALCRVLSVIAQARAVVAIPARAIAEVSVALRDLAVRDVMFGVAGGAHAHAAEHLWSVLTRALPDPDRAEAATLLAFSAYLRGDGVLAGIALEQALASDPEHRMAVLLDIGLQTALPPARLAKLVNSGIEAAADLRVDIGAATADSGTEGAR
ncbi:DUF4192 domain-containing protein [Nocardia puris]|uniref:DUF4192 domain-containing protein n=1 Tax=Nocardia TaxID=1817 RepID=UPI0006915CA9|nr:MULTISPECIES: DUF4192 domain-containing protein [Nocardia]MBF6137251.1 DUF4192 domain-containing protein [Nocardia otitidiscaviarum]MBF6181855.1 DUF4192 domain-containing protein [Nocardia otitidiscaviarum]MBF6216257.1 DUF4192 domain-containing protein [Nocardia puris]MBF6461748.1 DUF4192 domain-containing protein [Nocardia puris]MBF6488147.1 DUF4192 domain-containing protein [Nocardia otitidiscaviarum]